MRRPEGRTTATPDDDPLTWAAALECAECGRPWFDPADRWRSFLDDEDEPRLYCPRCGEAEFGDS
jgi:DNA-directed RNA polymerase subunit RPC12/RpoP